MMKLKGVLKLAFILMIDFYVLYLLFDDIKVAAIITIAILLYALLGGYISIYKEDAVHFEELPSFERAKLENAKEQLVEDVKRVSSIDISGMKLYLIPNDEALRATSYGANCISVTKGILDNTDPMTLNSIIAHETSHIMNLDSEVSRVVFANVLFICGCISTMSFSFVVVAFFILLACGLYRSLLGLIAFKGIIGIIGSTFSLIQKAIVLAYQAVASCITRYAEYRSDLYSAQLGYGVQLAHFLSYAAPESYRQHTLIEALYRTHPATHKRIARLENYLNAERHSMIKT